MKGQHWVRLLPLALLIVLGLAGLRGAVGTPRWDGPLHRDGVAVGLALEAVFAVLAVLTLRGGSVRPTRSWSRASCASRCSSRSARARRPWRSIMLLGAEPAPVHPPCRSDVPAPPAADPAPGAGPRTRTGPRPRPSTSRWPRCCTRCWSWCSWRASRSASGGPGDCGRRSGPGRTPSSWRTPRTCGRRWSRAVRRCGRWTTPGPRSSPATWPWSRAWPNGARPGASRTRPTSCWPGPGPAASSAARAAARLTALFYEARFSSHPLGPAQRDAAEQALDELAAALAQLETEPESAGASS